MEHLHPFGSFRIDLLATFILLTTFALLAAFTQTKHFVVRYLPADCFFDPVVASADKSVPIWDLGRGTVRITPRYY